MGQAAGMRTPARGNQPPKTGGFRPGTRRQPEARARVDALLRAAERSFLRHGYEATSLDRILAQAGGSKATLRKYFGDKAGLFAAVVENASARRIAAFRIRGGDASPQAWLQAFGEGVLRFYLEPASLTIYRAVIAIGHRDPKPARAFYERGHRAFVALLASRLRGWKAGARPDPRQARADADRFLHLLRAGPYERALLGLGAAPRAAALRAHVRACVRLYMKGVG